MLLEHSTAGQPSHFGSVDFSTKRLGVMNAQQSFAFMRISTLEACVQPSTTKPSASISLRQTLWLTHEELMRPGTIRFGTNEHFVSANRGSSFTMFLIFRCQVAESIVQRLDERQLAIVSRVSQVDIPPRDWAANLTVPFFRRDPS